MTIQAVVRTENWIVRAPGDTDRIEACFSGAAFAPHRHDTYAIGITLKGVQSFDYRGATRHSRPGQLVILHPDELHDGRAGDDGVFQYRTAYVTPSDIQGVLGGQSLPFVEGGVSSDPRLHEAVCALLDDYQRPLGDFEYQDALFDLAASLQRVAGFARKVKAVNRQAAMHARDYIDARLNRAFSLADLERATRHDRWQLSRDFRALFGTSPYRYLTLRRLDKVRRMLLDGTSLAEAAASCGFADQSHFGRLFKKSVGLTPKVWLAAMRAHDRSIPQARLRPN
jgi:AraC-like DNA-binding protein